LLCLDGGAATKKCQRTLFFDQIQFCVKILNVLFFFLFFGPFVHPFSALVVQEVCALTADAMKETKEKR
jgi:hypothetical protein